MPLYFTQPLPLMNCISLHQGRATYSDKLFKFRNGRFEDLLNDDINEHRDVANPMAGRSVACVDRKVLHAHTQNGVQYVDLHRTHQIPLESSAYMHGCFCLFTSDNSCPAYATPLSMCYDSSFGEMVWHFLSSVHLTSVITEAKARLFYRTSYEGGEWWLHTTSSAWSIFLLSLSLFVFYPFPLFSFLLTETLFLCLLSHTHTHTHTQLSRLIRGRDKDGNGGKRTAGITIEFLTTVPSHWALIGCAGAKQIGKISAFNGVILLEEAKATLCARAC